MCLNEIGLQGQNMLTIIDLMFNMICGGNLYEILMSMGIFPLIMDKIFI